MTRQEYIAVCSTCTNRKFNPKLGIICGLTSEIASFENTCESYDDDQEQIAALEKKETSYTNKNDSTTTKDIFIGGAIFVGGVVATVADLGYVFYGAIIFGGFKLVQGLMSADEA